MVSPNSSVLPPRVGARGLMARMKEVLAGFASTLLAPQSGFLATTKRGPPSRQRTCRGAAPLCDSSIPPRMGARGLDGDKHGLVTHAEEQQY